MDFKNELEKTIPENIKLTEKEKARIRYRVRESKSTKVKKPLMKPILMSLFCMIIVGVLVLSSKQSPEKEIALNQMNSNNLDDLTIPLREEQKQEYYEQYITIVEEAMAQKTGLSLNVPPIEEFKESDWVAPEEYEEMVQKTIKGFLRTEREKMNAVSSNIEPAVTIDGETIKSTYLYFPDILREVEVTANFDTQYSTEHDRQVFATVENVATQLANSPGQWKQTSYQTYLVDGGQKYKIRIDGIFTLNNLSFEKSFTIDFNCDEFGSIS